MSLEDVGHFDHPKGFQYSKCLKLPDGRLLFTPFNAEAVLLFDPVSKTSEKVGHFEGDCKWSGCAALPNGKVVFVPQYGLHILIFDPLAKTWDEVPIDPAWQKDPHFPKFSDCLTLPDGRVLFVPYYYTAIVIFDPATKTWEEIGHFEGNAKWSGCKLLPDNRLVFVPFSSPSILIFDLKTRSQEMVGNWEGGFKWSGSSELLPDGRLVFAPLKYKSILVFDPARHSWEEVGDFGNDRMKWNGCHLAKDGRVVFAPLDSLSVLFFNPSDKTWAEMPHGKTRDEDMPQAHGHGCRMCTDCAALPDGRVVFVPCSCKEIVIYNPPGLLRPSTGKGMEAGSGVATSPLAQFLQDGARVDPKVVAYMTKALQLETISDFANYWTRGEYQKGVQTDVVQQTAGFQDASSMTSRLQVARLRAAWKLAQNQAA